jgi:serine/threonine protein kinase
MIPKECLEGIIKLLEFLNSPNPVTIRSTVIKGKVFPTLLCQDLLNRMLQKEPQKRITWNELEKNEWFDPNFVIEDSSETIINELEEEPIVDQLNSNDEGQIEIVSAENPIPETPPSKYYYCCIS